jgi:uncharacterized protein (TIGR01777 family)
MRILLAGASGLIGAELRARLVSPEWDVRLLVRSEQPGHDEAGCVTYLWDARPGSVPGEAMEWAEAVVSLGGAPLGRLPWTAAHRRRILESRTQSTAAIAQAIRSADDPPGVWVSGSAVGVYGEAEAGADESTGPGTGFLADVVRQWEAATQPAQDKTRVVLARTGLVISGRGTLAPLFLAARLGLAGPIGSGRQSWSWISLADEARALAFAVAHDVAGPVNLVSPNPARAEDVTREIARQAHRPHWLPLPAVLLRAALRDAADDLLLCSQRVVPGVLLRAGFTYAEPTLESAVAAAWRDWRKDS